MLKECEQHGYFRGPECPQCGQEGRFLMDDRELDHIGRVLTGILRHFPERYGLTMDEHGWVSLPQIVRAISQRHRGYHWLRVHHLVAIAETDAKGRYEVRDDRIRATYAHTVDVQLDLPTDRVPDLLYYPVTEDEAPIVLEVGLRPSDRKKVHLSKTAEDARAAGSVRTPQPVILEVDTRAARAAGLVIMRAGTTVFLIDSVPPEYLRRAPTAEPAA
ncbi:MAG: RNA 2'-phosphotransferase [Candidatus Thermoplasmatota archaeon]|jgi:putative RNA 2'-phosphotransferase|nr:RNA 2'-phosphotransferase [Candidatus Thermoplasmatota archaeon]MCL5983590.1 RNA 2'-phosphotransferase [Candidatus Thermoplasmatota archaeon]